MPVNPSRFRVPEHGCNVAPGALEGYGDYRFALMINDALELITSVELRDDGWAYIWTEGLATPWRKPIHDPVYAYRLERIPDERNVFELDRSPVVHALAAEYRDVMGFAIERLKSIGLTRDQIDHLYYEALGSHFS